MDAGRLLEDGLVVAAAAAAWLAISTAKHRRADRRTRTAGGTAGGTALPPPGTTPAETTPSDTGDTATVKLSAAPPDRLPTFADVGGFDALKQEMRDTFGLILAHTKEADAYRIEWNGLLLFGPPGVGKSFFVKALAGEFKLNFVSVTTADLVSDYAGEGPHLVEKAFAFARSHEPALLFFDEFDAVAQSRQDTESHMAREVLMQLLQSVESCRSDRRLLVVAATNDLDALDHAVIRPGRFDRHVRLDLPDEKTRAAIFRAALSRRPVAKEVNYDELAERSRGKTPAAIAAAVEVAALATFRVAAGTGRPVQITMDRIRTALDHSGGEDRPTVEQWSWAKLVLPSPTLAELREIQAVIEDPDRCRRFGVDQPTGLLLTGPPGTGKTTVAKVLAAEASCSFYPVSGADVTSRWVGESERLIARLFHRARDNAPSIIFVDEIDAIGGVRGEFGAFDRQIDQLLQEIEGMVGQAGVLVIGATNRPDRIDPALRRGGRLSRTIEIPLPDADGRLAILRLMTGTMPLRGIDLEALALETEGFSGADLKALCQQAALEAMIRTGQGGTGAAVTADDVARALAVETDAVANQVPAHVTEGSRSRPLRAPRH